MRLYAIELSAEAAWREEVARVRRSWGNRGRRRYSSGHDNKRKAHLTCGDSTERGKESSCRTLDLSQGWSRCELRVCGWKQGHEERWWRNGGVWRGELGIVCKRQPALNFLLLPNPVSLASPYPLPKGRPEAHSRNQTPRFTWQIFLRITGLGFLSSEPLNGLSDRTIWRLKHLLMPHKGRTWLLVSRMLATSR